MELERRATLNLRTHSEQSDLWCRLLDEMVRIAAEQETSLSSIAAARPTTANIFHRRCQAFEYGNFSCRKLTRISIDRLNVISYGTDSDIHSRPSK